MKTKTKQLIIAIAIPLIVGAISSWLTMGNMEDFRALNQPPLSPPNWLFPVVWTILYILMGIASYLVYRTDSNPDLRKRALTVYAVQLAFNFLWSIVFFNFKWYLFAFIWLIALWVLIYINIKQFSALSKPAGYMLIPYLIWVTFALYLNFGIYILN